MNKISLNFNIALIIKEVPIICSNTFNRLYRFLPWQKSLWIPKRRAPIVLTELQMHWGPLEGAAVPPFSVSPPCSARRCCRSCPSRSLFLITLCVSPPLFIILSHPSSPRHLPCPPERRIHGVCDLEAVRFCVCVLVYEPGLLFVCA